MDCKLREDSGKQKASIPQVGQCWKFKEYPDIYMRITDEFGRKCFSVGIASFFSVHLKNGTIIHTLRESDVVLLKPTEKIILFEEV